MSPTSFSCHTRDVSGVDEKPLGKSHEGLHTTSSAAGNADTALPSSSAHGQAPYTRQRLRNPLAHGMADHGVAWIIPRRFMLSFTFSKKDALRLQYCTVQCAVRYTLVPTVIIHEISPTVQYELSNSTQSCPPLRLTALHFTRRTIILRFSFFIDVIPTSEKFHANVCIWIWRSALHMFKAQLFVHVVL